MIKWLIVYYVCTADCSAPMPKKFGADGIVVREQRVQMYSSQFKALLELSSLETDFSLGSGNICTKPELYEVKKSTEVK